MDTQSGINQQCLLCDGVSSSENWLENMMNVTWTDLKTQLVYQKDVRDDFDTSSPCLEGKRQDRNAKYAHSDNVSPHGMCKPFQMASVDTRCKESVLKQQEGFSFTLLLWRVFFNSLIRLNMPSNVLRELSVSKKEHFQ